MNHLSKSAALVWVLLATLACFDDPAPDDDPAGHWVITTMDVALYHIMNTGVVDGELDRVARELLDQGVDAVTVQNIMAQLSADLASGIVLDNYDLPWDSLQTTDSGGDLTLFADSTCLLNLQYITPIQIDLAPLSEIPMRSITVPGSWTGHPDSLTLSGQKLLLTGGIIPAQDYNPAGLHLEGAITDCLAVTLALAPIKYGARYLYVSVGGLIITDSLIVSLELEKI